MKTRICLQQSLIAVAFALASMGAHAHFKLDAPASWINEDDKGDPQKLAPCGGTVADGGARSGAITEVQGGAMTKLAVTETVYHPGHYRVALARRMNLLPADPAAVMKTNDKGQQRSDYAAVDPNPKAPVLLDGLWASQQKLTPPLETMV
ncbi:MAG: hypothetical protein V4603_04840, partial [Pseudomonadota bacterium]